MMTKTDHLYVHVPFCKSICYYCDFCRRVYDKTLADRWLKALKKEIDETCFGFYETIYIGGGTPTSLPDAIFEDVLRSLHDAFVSDALVEFCVEAGRPDTMTPAKLESMARYGVNRVSANPQTMQAKTLRRIGRRHEPEDIVRMVHDLRASGIPCINMDVIVGLPGENVRDIRDTMEKLGSEEHTSESSH